MDIMDYYITDNGNYLMDKLPAFQLDHHDFTEALVLSCALHRLASVSGKGTAFQPGKSSLPHASSVGVSLIDATR